MRRKDKAIEDKQAVIEILKGENVCTLALSKNDVPYIVTMNYAYHDNALLLHAALDGKKIDMLRANNKVAFTVVSRAELVVKGTKGCSWTTKFASVVGMGKASFVEDSQEKIGVMKHFMVHYAPGDYEFSEDDVKNVAVIKIAIEEMTGKATDAQRYK